MGTVPASREYILICKAKYNELMKKRKLPIHQHDFALCYLQAINK